jgi:S-adenosylmethionine-diacylglycerol 3-amino-3-carboxypropyl transferase
MITSAGCNALDYLLDDPRLIHCVDVNHRQNALLHLKQAAYRSLDWPDFFALFGRGAHPRYRSVYNEQLREWLPQRSRRFWDRHVRYFRPTGRRNSLYFHGTSGYFAWLIGRFLRSREGLLPQIQAVFEAPTLAEQQRRYEAIEEQLLAGPIRWLLRRHFAMHLVGVPASQQLLCREQYESGTLGYIRDCLQKVFTTVPARDNYFYQLYLKGRFSTTVCPEYLREHHFTTLRDRSYRLRTYDQSITRFLQQHPGRYSHFVLLDHQDWLARHDYPALVEEWRQILANSRPGTRILLRSASSRPDFLPSFIHDRVTLQEEACAREARRDRVGTYAGVFLFEVR